MQYGTINSTDHAIQQLESLTKRQREVLVRCDLEGGIYGDEDDLGILDWLAANKFVEPNWPKEPPSKRLYRPTAFGIHIAHFAKVMQDA